MYFNQMEHYAIRSREGPHQAPCHHQGLARLAGLVGAGPNATLTEAKFAFCFGRHAARWRRYSGKFVDGNERSYLTRELWVRSLVTCRRDSEVDGTQRLTVSTTTVNICRPQRAHQLESPAWMWEDFVARVRLAPPSWTAFRWRDLSANGSRPIWRESEPLLSELKETSMNQT